MKRYLIKWRNRAHSLTCITGLSRFHSEQAAEIQVARWNILFPFNSYWIEPAA